MSTADDKRKMEAKIKKALAKPADLIDFEKLKQMPEADPEALIKKLKRGATVLMTPDGIILKDMPQKGAKAGEPELIPTEHLTEEVQKLVGEFRAGSSARIPRRPVKSAGWRNAAIQEGAETQGNVPGVSDPRQNWEKSKERYKKPKRK
ncbi:hypothetical protein ACFLQ2_04830 [archaeon]